jgi:hypothetical protein
MGVAIRPSVGNFYTEPDCLWGERQDRDPSVPFGPNPTTMAQTASSYAQMTLLQALHELAARQYAADGQKDEEAMADQWSRHRVHSAVICPHRRIAVVG